MDYPLNHICLVSVAFLILFSSAEILYHKYNLKVEYTRKLVHLGSGLLALALPFIFNSHWIVLGLSIVFFMILIGSQYFNWLPSINAVKRKTRGAQVFPLVLYSSFLFYDIYDQLLFYYLPILLLSICDPIAALVGKKYPLGIYKIKGHQKTLTGSLAFAISAVVVTVVSVYSCDQYLVVDNMPLVVGITLLVTLAEALVINGYDNVSIPVATWFMLTLFHQPIIQYV